MELKKITTKEYFLLLKQITENKDIKYKQQLITFIDKQINSLDNKAQKAKERKKAKRLIGDELKQAIREVLINEYQTIDDIIVNINAMFDIPDITHHKVAARVAQLVKEGFAEQDFVKVMDKKHKVNAYKIKKGN